MKHLIAILLFVFASSAYSADYMWTTNGRTATASPTPSGSCAAYAALVGTVFELNYTGSCKGSTFESPTTYVSCIDFTSKVTGQYISTSCYYTIRSGNTCPAGQTVNTATGLCQCPAGQALNPSGQCVPYSAECAAKKGQPTNWKAEYPNQAAFDANPIRCTTSQDGCAVDVCDSVTHDCFVDGRTGKFVCSGKGGKYTGDPQAVSSGPGVDGCTGAECEPKPPQESSSSQDCTTPTASNGVTSYSCVSESNKNEWGKSNCSVGNVNGVQGLHCTSPDYVPEYDGKKRTDDVSEQSNPDGGKTTTTNTTDDRTHCKGGDCTSSSTSSTTTTTTDGSGKVTGETSTCKGVNCGSDGKPRDPEDEAEEEGEPTPLPPGSINGPEIADALPEIGGDGDLDMTESTAAYFNRIASAPIVEAFTSIAVPSGGSCNIGSASLFGGSVSFNGFCQLAPDVLSGLRYLFLAIWAWAAIRLFGTA